MAAVELVDFLDIYSAVLEELKIPSSDTTALARIKRDINMVYVNEVCAKERWNWLRKDTKVVLPSVYTTGTISVTNASATATLSAATAASIGSLANYYIKVEGSPEVYDISAHTSSTDTLTLSSVFIGSTNTAASYQIWTDRVALPTDCRETYQITHDHDNAPLLGLGKQKLNQIRLRNPSVNDYPRMYTTDDYFDPSSGDGETESDRYRVTRVYPALNSNQTLLHIDYIQEPDELDVDGDEPLMPLEDRIILVYGALSKAWLRERNPEQAAINEQKFSAKLGEMKAKVDDSMDFPTIEADNDYLKRKRGNSILSYNWKKV